MTKIKCNKKIAFLVLANDNIEILNLFLKQLLEYGESYIFLHIDAKVQIEKINIIKDKRIVIVERIYCSWGDYSLVQCVLNLYHKANSYDIDFDYYSIHSDADLAIGNVETFVNYLSINGKHAYLRCSKLPYKGWGISGGFERLDLYFPKIFRQKMKKYNVLRILKVLYIKIYGYSFIWKFKSRKHDYYGGSFWHTVDKYCVKKILEYINNHPEYCNLFNNSLISDEIFFNTVIILAIGTDNVEINNNLRYIDWTENNSKYGGSPKMLTVSDYDKIIKSNKFFARKFNLNLDKKIIDKILKYKKVEVQNGK